MERYPDLPQKAIRREIQILQKRLSALTCFNFLYETNPPFFDEDDEEISVGLPSSM